MMKVRAVFRLLNKERLLCRLSAISAANESLNLRDRSFLFFKTVIKRCVSDSARQKPAMVVVQVMGNGNDGSARAVLIRAPQQSYLFNCGEGMTRFCLEHRVKLGRVKNFFITYNSWQNLGGLPLVLLGLDQFVTDPRVLHGPPNVETLVDITQRFIPLQNVKVVKRELSKPAVDDVSGMKIESVPLFGSKQIDGKRDIAVAYICKFEDSRLKRRLNIEKCVDYGVPVGPLLKELSNGKDVTLPDGKIVRSNDVCQPNYGSAAVIVVECPNKNFLSPLLDAQEFTAYQHSSRLCPTNVACDVIVHFTPAHIMQHKKYQQWIKRFPKTTSHLVVNDSCPGHAAANYHEFQNELRLLHQEIFPPLPNKQKAVHMSFPGISNIIHCEPLFQYRLLSEDAGIDRSKVLNICSDEKSDVQKMCSSPKLMEELTNLQNNPLYVRGHPSTAASYPEVVFLGTSATSSTTVRSCCSTLIHLSEDKVVMLDCGEGTATQMVRMYGQEKTKQILRKMSAIFVSHMHPDHHMGLLALLLERRKAFEEPKYSTEFFPVYLVYSPKIKYWLKAYHSMFEPILDDFRLISYEDILHNRRTMDDKSYRRLMWEIGLKEVSAEHVIHFATPYGVILTTRNGYKIVYSGDTEPCSKLIEAGKNCDLLLHEATMEEELIESAREKRHSTTNEAIEVGQKMAAKYTILTHISRRYSKIPFFTDMFTERVGVAFDFMKITMATLPIVPHFVPCLKLMYSTRYETFQIKSEQRHQLRKQTEERLRRNNVS